MPPFPENRSPDVLRPIQLGISIADPDGTLRGTAGFGWDCHSKLYSCLEIRHGGV